MPSPSTSSTTDAERISAINTIDESIPHLLSSAGTALSALSTAHPRESSTGTESQISSSSSPLEIHRDAFTASTTEFFTLVRRVGEQLRAQAGLIDDTFLGGASGADADSGRTERAREAGKEDGHLGSLDVGWLKSRLSGGEAAIEGTVWAEARALLEGDTSQSEN